MSELTDRLYTSRRRLSSVGRSDPSEEFYSDKSRIVFCSSFRRMMQKAQVFSLETNSSVRNRLTHSLEVADIGKTIARTVGKKLHEHGRLDQTEIAMLEGIVENACLIHDIGNPPFGHFGEEAIKGWFRESGKKLVTGKLGQIPFDDLVFDFVNFDGNPQGFRIVTYLHNDLDEFGLNLTAATLLASLKYPNVHAPDRSQPTKKKLGIFTSERATYEQICQTSGHPIGTRYFLAYLMELADDICYCLSDIADSFEKRIVSSREFKEEFNRICVDADLDSNEVIPKEPIYAFGVQVAIGLSRRIVADAALYFVEHIDEFLTGKHQDLADSIVSGKFLECLKIFSRRHIYTVPEAQRIEIAGHTLVTGLLERFGYLLNINRQDFEYFVQADQMRKYSSLDLEWRLFKQLSPRMVKAYKFALRFVRSDAEELVLRARLIVDYVSGLTDSSALSQYQTFMGIRID